MSKSAIHMLYVVLMIAIIVSVDVLFFRHHLRERLLANIAIVVVFAAVYFMYIKRV